jgi:hypothetical protein
MTESSEPKIYQIDSGLDDRAKHEKLNFILRQIQNGIGSTAKAVATLQSSGSGGGTSDHAALTHLSYATSGHTGFAPTAHTHSHPTLSNLDFASSGHTGFIGGSGTIGRISKFTAADTIGDSIIYENAGKIGIAEPSPEAILDAANMHTLYTDYEGGAAPSAPAAGHLRIYAATDAGINAMEAMDPTGLTGRLLQDTFRIARNTSGSPIGKAKAVYFTGSTGQKPNFSPAKSDSLTTMQAIGVTTAAVNDNNFTRLMVTGRLAGFDTTMWNEGDSLYVSSTTAGELTNVKPGFPLFAQLVATVEYKHATQGAILVNCHDIQSIGTTDHSQLSNLVAPADDHTQYLPISGNRAMDGQLGPKVVTLSDAAIIATDATLGNHFRVTLGGNRTLGNPTGAYDGQILRIELAQDGTGGRTISFGNKIIKPSNVPTIILTTTPTAVDMIQLVYNSVQDKYVITGVLTNIYGV